MANLVHQLTKCENIKKGWKNSVPHSRFVKMSFKLCIHVITTVTYVHTHVYCVYIWKEIIQNSVNPSIAKYLEIQWLKLPVKLKELRLLIEFKYKYNFYLVIHHFNTKLLYWTLPIIVLDWTKAICRGESVNRILSYLPWWWMMKCCIHLNIVLPIARTTSTNQLKVFHGGGILFLW